MSPHLWALPFDKAQGGPYLESKARFTLVVKANVQLKSSIYIAAKVEISPKGFTLGVKANVQLKSSISIAAKVEISPKGFTLGVKAEIENNLSNLLQNINKCWTLWPWLLA